MITKENVWPGARIRLATGDVVKVRGIAGDMITFEYESRAAPKADQPFLSAAYLRVDAPEGLPTAAAAVEGTKAPADEYVNPVVTCRLGELTNANVA